MIKLSVFDEASSLKTHVQSSLKKENSQNPYYLHHSDSFNHVLVSELLTNDNCVSWNCSMILALSIQNKLGFTNETLTQLTDSMLPTWIWNNHTIGEWILISVSEAIALSLLFFDLARVIWLDLK